MLSWAAGKLVGNVLLAAAFASYAGPFDMASRLRLVQVVWLPDLQQRAIPMTAAVLPLDVLTNSSVKVCPTPLQRTVIAHHPAHAPTGKPASHTSQPQELCCQIAYELLIVHTCL